MAAVDDWIVMCAQSWLYAVLCACLIVGSAVLVACGQPLYAIVSFLFGCFFAVAFVAANDVLAAARAEQKQLER